MFVAAEYETLHDFIMNKKPMIDKRMKLYIQLVKAMEYIHENGLVLCYLNPNWIFVIDGENPGEKQVSNKALNVSKKTFLFTLSFNA